MKLSTIALALTALALVASAALAAPRNPSGGLMLGTPQSGGTCIYNPLAPDDDGDGIPNGQDPDYVRPLDGTGRRLGRLQAEPMGPLAFLRFWWRQGLLGPIGVIRMSSGYGPGDGTGNGGVGPQDGTGYGPGASEGSCDGDGPHGFILRKNR